MTKTRTLVKWFGTFVATCAVALACSLGFSSTAYAETESVSWNVTYSAEKQMVSDYNQESVNQALSHMQPGDSFTMKVNLRNLSDTSTDWYMTSEAIPTRSNITATRSIRRIRLVAIIAKGSKRYRV